MRKRVGSVPKRNLGVLDLDSDDDDSVSSSSTTRSDRMSVTETEDVQKDKLLDHALDALFEKRITDVDSTCYFWVPRGRKHCQAIIDAFNSEMQHEFLEKKFATLLHQCVASVKKGSAKEVSLASQTIGLLAITVGCGDNAREIVEDAVPVLAQGLKSRGDPQKLSKLLECLAVITFVGGSDPAETEKAMEIMWQSVLPKLGSNVVAAKPSPAVISAMVSAWSFLLTSMDRWSLDPKKWQDSISYFSSLLEKEDRSVRIAAGEALALIFEMGSLEKFASDMGAVDGSNNGSDKIGGGMVHIHGLRAKVLNQVRNLSMEAGGKGSAKRDLNSQRNLFKDILEFLEDGSCPKMSVKIGGDMLTTTTWSQLVQLNYLKHFLGSGFVKHMQDNDLLHEIFGFTPKKNTGGARSSNRLFKSPNSILNKARTQYLNKQRMLSVGKNVGRFAVNAAEDEI
ncbi:hypothetical protein MLD38_002044 [Melastoma candidum]|uniref:Uncharacterized protein n=1 Tax=Melastoma candidum TaxID=119954 RepID=A0ACB9SG66_9MYRT|nr:hypothetical protein MLD38_002044 [Melastoma candidum]